MRILVQKFGGTSLSTANARNEVIQHIKRELQQGYHVVVVVSAMGRKGEPYATDTLLDWIDRNGGALPKRELDMLLGCGETISAATLCSLLEEAGIPASVLSGGQAGIVTDDRYGDASIAEIKPTRVLDLLAQRKVVIVTGFQGVTPQGDVTTLGRGGSDTSATALGAALRAEIVDIYTDVDGILTADPKVEPDARPIARVSFAEICNMASNGAKVVHPRAVEIAMQANLPVRVRSTFSSGEGTLVVASDALYPAPGIVNDRFVTGIAHVTGITQIRVKGEAGRYDMPVDVFKAMAKRQISVDFINVNPASVAYTVFDREAERAVRLLREMGYEPQALPGCAKISVIGGGMNGVPGIMARIVEALTEQDIAILQSADSNATIWVLVKGADLIAAVRTLHAAFELHRG
ncbi:aspartate kinase [Paenibacillus cymbidii]|uniref:aspartate kinase n=1 Tax=Paenibacillus cymbidii TaxID=1639034 RepID=UPI001081F547|nr:aspartate kinase [Paenibacillus cymbidii]